MKRQSERYFVSEPDQLELLLEEIASLRSELERLQNFRSSPGELHTLPERVQHYLRQLHKITEASDDEAALASARDAVDALARLNDELRKLLRECFKINP